MEATKKCSKCKDFKPLIKFDKNRAQKDSFHNQCKLCRKKCSQTKKYKATHKRYRQTEKSKVATKYFRTRHLEQEKARNSVKYAIKTGKLPRPDTLLCHYCLKPAQQYHHWHGYEQEHWLDVVPACIPCHSKCDRKIA